MLVAVGSLNPVKMSSANLAFERTWPDEAWFLKGCAVESGVSPQPLTDAETIEGARNRAAAALDHLEGDYGVGIEGGLQQVVGTWFAGVWAVVLDKRGREGIGAALKI